MEHAMSLTNLQYQMLEALPAISPDLPRNDWVKVGMSLHAAGFEFEVFRQWSSGGASYDARSCEQTWRSFKSDGAVKPATLFFIAQQHGYKKARTESIVPALGEVHKHKASGEKRKPILSAQDIWDRCLPVTDAHPYIVRKKAQGIPVSDLRIVPNGDELHIAKESMIGSLVVPIRRPDSSISSLQFITHGEAASRLQATIGTNKANLPGAHLDGWFTCGQVGLGSKIFVAEGVATAWTIWLATKQPSICCFGAGRMQQVSRTLTKIYPQSEIILCPDRGKEAQAKAIAGIVSASYVTVPPEFPNNADLCDVAAQNGIEAVAQLLNKPVAPEPPPMPFKLVSLADFESKEISPPKFIWEKLVPAEAVTLVAAHGGTGKSYLALMLGVAAALGLDLFGLPTKKCKVVFFSGEDSSSILTYRLDQICRSLKISVADLRDDLVILDSTDHDPRLFTDRDGLTECFAHLKDFLIKNEIGLFIIDNASDCFDGSEIDRAKVRSFMRSLTSLARQCKAGCVLLAHVDKGTSRGDRNSNTEGYSGSTSWHNSARSRIYLYRNNEGQIVLEQQKSTHTSALLEPIILNWPEGGIPTAEITLSPATQAISDRVNTKAILQLIHEFTNRGEYIATAPNSPSNPFKMLSREPNFPKRLKSVELADLIRHAERTGLLIREGYRNSDRKDRQRWRVTSKGEAFAEIIPSAPTAPSTPTQLHGADLPPEKDGGAHAPPSGDRGTGSERAHENDDKTPEELKENDDELPQEAEEF